MQARTLRIKLLKNPRVETDDILEILESKDPYRLTATNIMKNYTKSENVKSKNYWTIKEDASLIEGLKIHGKNWTKLLEHVGPSKTYKQMLKYAENMRTKDCPFFIAKN